MHFHDPEGWRALLKRLRGWITAGGALEIDLPNAGEAFAAPDTEAVTLGARFWSRIPGIKSCSGRFSLDHASS
ncbi:MAG: hypothetical protein U0703_13330 [Anaerolineae bacterium]